MSQISSTTMSSRGQVVIPEEVRRELNLETGVKFLVIPGKDSIILKKLIPPSDDEVNKLMKRIRDEARRVGLKKKDVEDAIKQARGRR